MIKKLVPSVSFPSPRTPAASPFHRTAAARTSYRTRSASLPTRLHPLAAHIDADLEAVILWRLSVPPSPASSASSPSSIAASVAWLSHGLVHLYHLLGTLSEVLQLPQAQDSLHRLLRADRRSASSSSSSQPCTFANRLLDDILRLTDAHASFRSATLDLKHKLSATHAALRHRNYSLSSLSSCVRSRRRTEREIARLVPAVREVGKRLPVLSAVEDGEESEVAGVLREVLKAAADASAAVFGGVASMSTAATPAVRFGWVEAALRWRERARARMMKKKWLGEEKEMKGKPNKAEEREVEWRNTEMERLVALEEGVATLESGSDKLFRALVNTRVCLLNIQTPNF